MDPLKALDEGIGHASDVLEHLKKLRDDVAREAQGDEWSKYKGKLCLFWDVEDSRGEPVSSRICLFGGTEHVDEQLCYAASDLQGHPHTKWRHFRPLSASDLAPFLPESTGNQRRFKDAWW